MPRHLIYCLLVLFVFPTGCFALSENEKFIQGTWHKEGVLSDHRSEFSWYMDWNFDRGRYIKQGYPPYYGEGKYKVIRSEGDSITLRLYGGTGNEEGDPREVTLKLDRANDTLIDNYQVMNRTGKIK